MVQKTDIFSSSDSTEKHEFSPLTHSSLPHEYRCFLIVCAFFFFLLHVTHLKHVRTAVRQKRKDTTSDRMARGVLNQKLSIKTKKKKTKQREKQKQKINRPDGR